MLVKQPRKNKWSMAYEPVFYVVCSICGSQVTATRVTDGRTVCRDASQIKLANAVINTTVDLSLVIGLSFARVTSFW